MQRLSQSLLKTMKKNKFFRSFSSVEEKSVPKYNPMEFESFKFNIEKSNLVYGYTMEELYGVRYGLKHSPEMRRQMSKDNVMFVIFVSLSIVAVLLSRNKTIEFEKSWKEYIYHDMNQVRPIVSEEKEDEE